MKVTSYDLIPPLPGTQRQLQTWQFGQEGPLAYLQAGLHADELPGIVLLHRLGERLAELEQAGRLRGRLVLVPLANPIGLAQHHLGLHQGRFEAGSGLNFNRDFPLLIRPEDKPASVGAARNLLQKRLAELPCLNELASLRRHLFGLALEADLVLDLHCDSEAALHIYANARQPQEAEALGAFLGAKAVLLAEEAGGMSFDDALMQNWSALAQKGDFNVPCFAATVELRGMLDVDEQQAEEDLDRLIDYLTWQGWIRSEKEVSPPIPLCQATPLAGVEVIHAPQGGLVLYSKNPGSRIEAGEQLGWILDPLNGVRTPMHSSVSGCCYARVQGRLAQAGQELLYVAGEEARRSGTLLGL